jgi:hypothetical protein
MGDKKTPPSLRSTSPPRHRRERREALGYSAPHSWLCWCSRPPHTRRSSRSPSSTPTQPSPRYIHAAAAGTRTHQEEIIEVELECWPTPAASPFLPSTPLVYPGPCLPWVQATSGDLDLTPPAPAIVILIPKRRDADKDRPP